MVLNTDTDVGEERERCIKKEFYIVMRIEDE